MSQGAKKLHKCPVFEVAGNTKKTLDLSAHDVDDACDDDDFQVVESHSSENAQSGNTSEYFGSCLHKLTSSCVPVLSSSPLSVPLFIRNNVWCQFVFIINSAGFVLLDMTCDAGLGLAPMLQFRVIWFGTVQFSTSNKFQMTSNI